MEETMNEVVESVEIAPIQSGQIVTFADNLMSDVTEQGYWASFPVVTMDDKKRLYMARNDNLLLKDYMGVSIELVDVVIDTQVINDPNFGAKKVPCVHLIAKDGKVYQSASSGVVNTACDIISTFGMPDSWGEPLEVVCKETDTKNGFRYKYLTVL